MPRKPDLSIIGKVFNNLRVDNLTDERNSYGQRLYSCTCLLCGKTRKATKQNLQRGEIKDCGNHHQYNDITGQNFGNLQALYVTDKKISAKRRCKVWHCKCLLCGKECDVLYNDLMRGNVQSCGCLKSEKIKQLFVDGTAPCKLDGSKIRSTNTSGTTGVWYDKTRNKWVAEIMFKGKKYYLGRFENKEEAVIKRKEEEERIFGDFLKNIGSDKNGTKNNR